MKIITAKTFTNSILLALFLTACGTSSKLEDQEKATELLSQQTVNAVIWFNTSAENAYIFEQSFENAARMVQENREKATSNRLPAVIVDIDETILDNSPYQIELMKKGDVFDQESWAKWVRKAEARTLPGAEKFLKKCEEMEIQVYYISNRNVKYLGPTMENLQKNGLPFADADHVLLMSDVSDKSGRRNIVEANHEVLVYIGDNLRDFDELFADRTTLYGRNVVDDNLEMFLPKCILLPNPMYGQWSKVFKFSEDATPQEKAQQKIEQTQDLDH